MVRIIESSLKRYPELVSFLEETDETRLKAKAQQLKFAYYITYQKPHYQFSAFTSPAKLCVRLQAIAQLKSLLKTNTIHLLERAELLNAACEAENLEMIELLLNIPGFINPCNPGLEAYQRTAEIGHLKILKRLLRLPTVQENLTINNNFALLAAARNGHLEVVKHLLTYPVIASNITSMDNFALRWAYSNDHQEVVDLLLRYPQVFSYAETQQHDYGRPYLKGFIQRWEDKFSQKLHQADSNSLILSNEEVKTSLFILHYLIYFYEPKHLNKIQTLLNIPDIRAQAHLPVINRNYNELLELARSKGHEDVTNLLLAIPNVHRLAEAADFSDETSLAYNEEMRKSSFSHLGKQNKPDIKKVENSHDSNTINTSTR